MSARDVIVVSVILLITSLVLFISSFMTNSVLDKAKNVTAINESQRAVQSMTAIQDQTKRFDYIFFAVFMGLMLGLMVTGWFIQSNPIFALAYILLIAFAVFISPILSNVYYAFITESIFASTINLFTLTNYIMFKLPYFITIFGILGLVIMFAKPYIVGNEI